MAHEDRPGYGHNSGAEPQEYNVALKSKETGVITWTFYPTKGELDADRVEVERHSEILAEGISQTECIDLCRSTPPEAYTKLAFLESQLPDGTIDTEALSHQLEKSSYAIRWSNSGRDEQP